MEVIEKIIEMRRTQQVKLVGFYAVLVAAFLYLCNSYIWFTAEESFVAYRYAENLVDHGVITWNVGQGPVEDFASFLWVILNAGALLMGVSPLGFSKGISILSVLLIVGFLVWKGRDKPWYLQLGMPAALALSPAVAVTTVQGLETMFISLLLFAVSIVSVWSLQSPHPYLFVAWYALVGMAGLADSATLLFGGGAFVVLGAILFMRDRSVLARFLLSGVPFVALGTAYVAWRIWYFGHIPSGPADLMSGAFGADVQDTVQFFTNVLVPYLFVGIISFASADDERSVEVIPTIAGAVLLGAYWVNMDPVQGVPWSEAIPVLPAVLYVCLHLPSPIESVQWRGQFAAATLGLLLVGWPLHTYADANRETKRRPPGDQIAVGKSIQGIEGRLFTEKGGALAYYSDWTVPEELGSVDDETHTASLQKQLQTFAPDLIGLRMTGNRISLSEAPWREVSSYIETNPYAAIAVTKSTDTKKHLYLIRATSPVCRETIGHLKQVRSIPHASVDAVVPDSLDLPVVDVLDWEQAGRACRQ